jgi:hypothetical protein
MELKGREDQDWSALGVEHGQIYWRGFFWSYWNHNHSKLIVRKPSKDIL